MAPRSKRRASSYQRPLSPVKPVPPHSSCPKCVVWTLTTNLGTGGMEPMTHCAVAESVFADLRPMLAEYLGEDVSEMDQQEREDRLMMALTDSFASRLDLANQKAELL